MCVAWMARRLHPTPPSTDAYVVQEKGLGSVDAFRALSFSTSGEGDFPGRVRCRRRRVGAALAVAVFATANDALPSGCDDAAAKANACSKSGELGKFGGNRNDVLFATHARNFVAVVAPKTAYGAAGNRREKQTPSPIQRRVARACADSRSTR